MYIHQIVFASKKCLYYIPEKWLYYIPEGNKCNVHLVQFLLFLEVSDISSDLFHHLPLSTCMVYITVNLQ